MTNLMLSRERFGRGWGVTGFVFGVVAVTAGLAAATEAQQTEVAAPARLEVTTASAVANQHFWAAIEEAQNIRFTSAAERLKSALDLDPSFGMARALHGFVAPGMTTTERSTEITRGITEMADATPAELLTAMAWREWTTGNTTEAKSLIDAAANLVPGDPYVAWYQAQLTAVTGDVQTGIAVFRSVIERFPDNAPAYNILGYRLYQTGDRQGGLEMIEKYVSMVPDHPNSHDSYAEILAWEGHFEKALSEYRRTLELDESWVQGLTGQAEVLQMMGKGKEARVKLTEAIAIARTVSGRINLHRAIANSFIRDGDRKSAMEHLETAASVAAENDLSNLEALAYQEVALYEGALGDGNRIEAHLVAASNAGSSNVIRHHAMATFAYASAGMTVEARESATTLEEMAESPSWINVSHVANGMISLVENNPSEAMTELSAADPDDMFCRILIAETYREMGNKTEADALRTDVLADRRINLFSAGQAIAHVRAAKF
jgi:tetratricopeptide (TPR) repeat protein